MATCTACNARLPVPPGLWHKQLLQVKGCTILIKRNTGVEALLVRTSAKYCNNVDQFADVPFGPPPLNVASDRSLSHVSASIVLPSWSLYFPQCGTI